MPACFYNLKRVSTVLLCFIFFFLICKADTAASSENSISPLPNAKLHLPPPPKASPELMAGQMIMVGFRGISSEELPIIKIIQDCYLGGVILFTRDCDPSLETRNIDSREQLHALLAGLHAESPYPLLTGIDQEGGKVRRLKWEQGFAPLPPAEELGKGNPAATRLAAGRSAAEMKELGINLDFAPVVDVNINPDSPAIGLIQRSFSADADTATAHARAFTQGLHAHGVLNCLKHFPGHGSASTDTHLGITDISQTWHPEQELYPYKILISEGLADLIMAGHLMNSNIDAQYPASLSQLTITGLLRNKLGFDGVVISDDLQMGAITSQYSLEEAILLAIQAGTDILLCGNNVYYDENLGRQMHNIILNLLAEGKISRERLEESYSRIRRLKEKLYDAR